MIRVIIADDHNLVRQGICALIEKTRDIEVVGEAADGQAAVELVERLAPEVAVLDIAMPRLNGIEAITRIRGLGQGTRVVMLSMHSDESVVRQALRNGALGYVLKRAVGEELLIAIRAASRNEPYFSSGIANVILADFLARVLESGDEGLHQLTSREREILQLVAEGHTNMDIANLLSVSVKTVEKHRASLMAKLDAHDLAALTRLAIKHGLVALE